MGKCNGTGWYNSRAKNYPSGTLLDLKLTGMQGDVMKESMNVAKTLAWSLYDPDVCIKNVEYYDKTKSQGAYPLSRGSNTKGWTICRYCNTVAL